MRDRPPETNVVRHAGVESDAPAAAVAWPDLKIDVAPRLLRIHPGRYQARSIGLHPFRAFKRRNLRLDFEVYQGEAAGGIVLGRVPLFCPLPERRLSSASRLARLFALLGVQLHGDRPVPLEKLRYRLWLVEIGDAVKDAAGAPLPQDLRYSVVKVVLEHLA